MKDSKKSQANYYVVREDVLPDVFLKVMEVKRLLDLKRVASVNEAVKRVGISRSAYYKYHKSIRALKTLEEGATTTILIVMEHIDGASGLCIAVFGQLGADIVAFQQSPPVDGLVYLMVTFRSPGILELEDRLMNQLLQTRGVVKVESLRQT